MIQIQYVLVIACILLTSFGQLLLKSGARNATRPYGAYLNLHTGTGYFLMLSVTICSVLALKSIDLKVFYVLMSFNYIAVVLLSWALLKDKLSTNKLIAIFLITAGVFVFNF